MELFKVSVFNVISTFVAYLMPKSFLLENCSVLFNVSLFNVISTFVAYLMPKSFL